MNQQIVAKLIHSELNTSSTSVKTTRKVTAGISVSDSSLMCLDYRIREGFSTGVTRTNVTAVGGREANMVLKTRRVEAQMTMEVFELSTSEEKVEGGEKRSEM